MGPREALFVKLLWFLVLRIYPTFDVLKRYVAFGATSLYAHRWNSNFSKMLNILWQNFLRLLLRIDDIKIQILYNYVDLYKMVENEMQNTIFASLHHCRTFAWKIYLQRKMKFSQNQTDRPLQTDGQTNGKVISGAKCLQFIELLQIFSHWRIVFIEKYIQHIHTKFPKSKRGAGLNRQSQSCPLSTV